MSINSINGSVSLGVPPQVDEEGNVITQDPDSDIKDPSAIQTDKINTPDSETIDDDIAFKGSIQFRFALYQLNYANQCRQNAVNYMGQIEQICDRSLWIHDGKIRAEGNPRDVHPQYLEYMGEGMKSIYLLSLLEAYVEDEKKLPSLVIMEYPEMFLHPRLQKIASEIQYRGAQSRNSNTM